MRWPPSDMGNQERVEESITPTRLCLWTWLMAWLIKKIWRFGGWWRGCSCWRWRLNFVFLRCLTSLPPCLLSGRDIPTWNKKLQFTGTTLPMAEQNEWFRSLFIIRGCIRKRFSVASELEVLRFGQLWIIKQKMYKLAFSFPCHFL